MVVIKVIELAKEKNLTTNDIFDICDSLGISIKGQMSVLNDSQVKKIEVAFKKQEKRKAREAIEEKAREAERKIKEAEEKIKEAARKVKEEEKKAREAAKKAREEEKKAREAAKKVREAEKKAKEDKKKAEEDKKIKAEEEAKRKIEAKREAEEAKRKAEEDKKIKAEKEAKREVEEKARKIREDAEKKQAKEKAAKISKTDAATRTRDKKRTGLDIKKPHVIKKKTSAKKDYKKEPDIEPEETVYEIEGKPVTKHRKKMGWEEEKKFNIRSVLSKELDREEKDGRLKVRFLQKKRAETGKARKKAGTKERQTLEEARKKRPEIKKTVEIPEGVTVKQLSERVNIPSNEIITILFNMGETITLNDALSKDLIEYLSHEYGFKYRMIGFEEKMEEVYQDAPEDLLERAPIVTVMGHVDHGKTTLLDSIRETSVAIGEAGGITQHIGAYQVEYNDRKITFIDTPGHEAFTSIRARGAKVTDIAIIVVAADDGIMPQTVEAINHAKDAGVPIIVAINKIDLPNADTNKIKQSLTEHDLVPEEWGGDTVVVEISAKNKINLDDLLEMVLLVTDMNEIKGNPTAVGMGIIIEARLDKGMGAIGTLIVKRGTIKIGDSFVTGEAYGRIRSIKDEARNKLKEAKLSQPVEVTGFSSVPKAGDKLFIVKNEKVAKELLARKNYERKMMQVEESRRTVTLENLAEISREEKIKKLKIILKAESGGSVDAVEKSLANIEHDEIKIEIIHKGIGAITDTDILLAAAANAIVVGFGVVPTAMAGVLNKKEKVDIRTYRIIYKLIDDIRLAFEGMLEPETVIIEKGKAEVREVFKVSKIGQVAGSYIIDGSVERGNMARIIRDGAIIYEGKIVTLQRFKDDVKTVASGYECGVRVENYQDIKKDDILEFFEVK
ncbi:MAG: translation initiation factor IF-2 [Actinomycetota bacterium]|nr:MAG: translation initiation factor IF-2 [Actinomycetota bacterium]